ncbi:glycosyltransferase family 2 protein [Candidatus Bathyarchaeota archaeon]|nr:glycosyltransferase family 2 protein [Candidatus Bathyarchaeota archaeon]
MMLPGPQKIDVVLLTKNSEKPYLKMCLESIYANIPVRKLIVIDGYSSDNTLRLLDNYPNVSIIQMHGSRGASRQKGINEVETEWFAFIDSDVILCKKWYDKIRININDSTGAIWGVAIPTSPSDLKRCLAVSKFYHRSLGNTMLIEGNRRGMLHDTIIRTRLVKDIKIPSELHVWEDHYLKQHIINKGFSWISTNTAYCHHFANLTARNIQDLIEFGRISRAYGYYSWRRILIFAILGLPKASWIYALTRDADVAKWQLDAYRMIIAGWLSNEARPKTN